MSNWNEWPTVKPEKNQRIEIIFRDGRQESNYIYGGGVVFLMPPDHRMYTYATPRVWRPMAHADQEARRE